MDIKPRLVKWHGKLFKLRIYKESFYKYICRAPNRYIVMPFCTKKLPILPVFQEYLCLGKVSQLYCLHLPTVLIHRKIHYPILAFGVWPVLGKSIPDALKSRHPSRTRCTGSRLRFLRSRDLLQTHNNLWQPFLLSRQRIYQVSLAMLFPNYLLDGIVQKFYRRLCEECLFCGVYFGSVRCQYLCQLIPFSFTVSGSYRMEHRLCPLYWQNYSSFF